MEHVEVKDKLKQIIKNNLKYESKDDDCSLFDEFAAYELLYIVSPIENMFNISIASIIMDSDYTVMSINNLSRKIMEIIDDKSCDN